MSIYKFQICKLVQTDQIIAEKVTNTYEKWLPKQKPDGTKSIGISS